MRMRARWIVMTAVVPLALGSAGVVSAADWPQFMRDAAHTGDAADEDLQPPLGLVAQVQLDDAVMTSPAVVAGLAYVVDQMGTAYCVDPKAGRILWRAVPDGAKAMGSNTSSPCVVQGRVYYGTTAGTLHVLDARNGETVKTLEVGAPIISAPTAANGAIYVQALDAVVRCLDLDGNERWRWDHYARYREPPEVTRAQARRRGFPGSYDRPHYGGGEVAVSGTKVVTSMGWDLLCLEDTGREATLAWCRRCPTSRDGASPMSSSISAGWVYTAGMGADGALGLMRLSLADGSDAETRVPGIPFPWITPAVRDGLVTTRNCGWLKDEIQVYEIGKRRTTLWQDPREATPVITSHALTRDHCVVTTLKGEVLVLDLAPTPKRQPFRFKPMTTSRRSLTPSGRHRARCRASRHPHAGTSRRGRGGRLCRTGPLGSRLPAAHHADNEPDVLAPDIQEALLFLPGTDGGRAVGERQVRPICALRGWRKQRRVWEEQKESCWQR